MVHNICIRATLSSAIYILPIKLHSMVCILTLKEKLPVYTRLRNAARKLKTTETNSLFHPRQTNQNEKKTSARLLYPSDSSGEHLFHERGRLANYSYSYNPHTHSHSCLCTLPHPFLFFIRLLPPIFSLFFIADLGLHAPLALGGSPKKKEIYREREGERNGAHGSAGISLSGFDR